MSLIREFFEDSTKQGSSARLCFIFGTFGCFSLATAQFCGYGEIPTALYIVLATLASGGYAISKTNDRLQASAEYDVGSDTEQQ